MKRSFFSSRAVKLTVTAANSFHVTWVKMCHIEFTGDYPKSLVQSERGKFEFGTHDLLWIILYHVFFVFMRAEAKPVLFRG